MRRESDTDGVVDDMGCAGGGARAWSSNSLVRALFSACDADRAVWRFPFISIRRSSCPVILSMDDWRDVMVWWRCSLLMRGGVGGPVYSEYILAGRVDGAPTPG